MLVHKSTFYKNMHTFSKVHRIETRGKKIMRQEIQKAIDFLNGYQWIKKDIKKLKTKIEDLEETMGITGVIISDMPKAHTNNISRPTERIALELVELKTEQGEQVAESLEKLEQIENVIESVDKHQLQDLLYYRYIEGLTIEQTADEMGISERHAYRIQPKAWAAVARIMGFKSDIIDPNFIQDYVRWKNQIIQKLQ